MFKLRPEDELGGWGEVGVREMMFQEKKKKKRVAYSKKGLEPGKPD